MASRAIIRRRKYYLEHTNAPLLLHSSNSIFGRGTFGFDVQLSTVCHLSEQNSGDSDREKGLSTLRKRDHLGLSNGFLWRPTLGASLASYESKARNLGFPLGARYFLQPVRTASKTAGQPKTGVLNEQSEDHKQPKKEASPEECDQAVEGLSTAKAKAKAKQVQEVQKTDQSIIQKFWARLLGIGPALRVVAAMSRSWTPSLNRSISAILLFFMNGCLSRRFSLYFVLWF
jgi:LETM1 and EF-hand domain-containing protein 1